MSDNEWKVILERIERGIESGDYLPLFPEHRMYLSIERKSEIGKRFARVFVSTWMALPEEPKRNILRYWETHAYLGCPFIECSDLWRPSKAGSIATTTFAQCSAQFSASSIASMCDAAVAYLVAHELAHFYQKSIGIEPVGYEHGVVVYENKRTGDRLTTPQNELHADKLAESWGFPEAPLIEWEWRNMPNRSKQRFGNKH